MHQVKRVTAFRLHLLRGVALLGWLSIMVPPVTEAYVLDGQHWPSNQPITLTLSLGNPSSALSDGSTSWNDVAIAAMDIWNPYLGSGVQFRAVVAASLSGRQGDHKNSVFFSPAVFGESFGDDTLAVTVTPTASGTIKTEADVVVNSHVTFDSYRGSLRGTALGGTEDLRRVLIHEFGHVLGLDHVSQHALSIMTPDVTQIDTIQEDDIAGVSAIYNTPSGHPEFYGATSLSDATAIGASIRYQLSR